VPFLIGVSVTIGKPSLGWNFRVMTPSEFAPTLNYSRHLFDGVASAAVASVMRKPAEAKRGYIMFPSPEMHQIYLIEYGAG